MAQMPDTDHMTLRYPGWVGWLYSPGSDVRYLMDAIPGFFCRLQLYPMYLVVIFLIGFRDDIMPISPFIKWSGAQLLSPDLSIPKRISGFDQLGHMAFSGLWYSFSTVRIVGAFHDHSHHQCVQPYRWYQWAFRQHYDRDSSYYRDLVLLIDRLEIAIISAFHWLQRLWLSSITILLLLRSLWEIRIPAHPGQCVL